MSRSPPGKHRPARRLESSIQNRIVDGRGGERCRLLVGGNRHGRRNRGFGDIVTYQGDHEIGGTICICHRYCSRRRAAVPGDCGGRYADCNPLVIPDLDHGSRRPWRLGMKAFEHNVAALAPQHDQLAVTLQLRAIDQSVRDSRRRPVQISAKKGRVGVAARGEPMQHELVAESVVSRHFPQS